MRKVIQNSLKITSNNMKRKEINCEKKTKSGFYCNSFERFSDDLCELLLSYLSISDKIHFECVSKQWQRLVFNKQQKLILNDWNESYDTIIIENDKKLSLIIECLTKKFKFINDLEIDNDVLFDVNKQIIEIIVQNCQYLKGLSFFGQEFRECYELFGQKLLQKLEFINICGIDKKEMKLILKSTHNLKAIKIYEEFDALIEQYLPKLVEIKIFDSKHFSFDSFENFVNLYKKQIKKISFDDWTEKRDKYIPYLLRFENLETFIIGFDYYHWNKDFISMAKQLKNLKHLSITAEELNESFDRLKAFNNLEVFELVLYDFREEDIKVIETLNLTKLQIYLGIHDISDQLFEKLAKMKRLSKLLLDFESEFDSGICQLIKNSPKLKNIELNDKHINETTIKAFVEKALNSLKTYYKLIARNCDTKRITDNSIPKNLLILKEM
jgi:hypothetical protein